MIIADDEYLVRDFLQNDIPWEKFGINVVAVASNGQESFELCIKFTPDILFTDISMPEMDGLEVALKLKETRL